MSKARDFLIEQLAPLEDLEDPFRVLPFARGLSPARKPTVLVRVDEVAPVNSAGARRVRVYTFGVIVLGRHTTGDNADDEIDALLEDVLAVLDSEQLATAGITWTAAKRGTWQDTAYPAYEVTTTVPLKIGA